MIIEVSKSVCKVIGVLLVIVAAGALYWYMYMYDPMGDNVVGESSIGEDVSGTENDVAEDGAEAALNAEGESAKDAEASGESAEEAGEKSDETATDPVAEPEVFLAIHVSGAVLYPDRVYYLEEGKRVEDAVKAAGGALEEADLSLLNLARLLQDGERIYVPKVGEDYEEEPAMDSGIQDVVENQEKPLTNINLATTIELMELPGIGEAYAERIIEYREANGGFQSIEDIKNVSGIGDSTFEKIKDRITVSE